MKSLGILILFFFLSTAPISAQLNTQNILQRGKNAIFFDDYVSAIDNFNSIIRIKPYLSEPYFFRGVAKMSLEDYDGAIHDYDQAIELNPNYFLAYMYRGIAYNGLKKHDIALKDFNTAIAIDPRNPYVYANRGITKATSADYKGAEKDYSKALLIEPALESAYLNRAIMREKLDDLKGAMSDCNSAIKLNMFSDDAYSLRGYLWYKQKDYHSAIEDFNRAEKANPKNINVLMNRALVYYEMKKFQETMDDFSKAIAVDSLYIYAYYNRAMLRAEIGDNNRAIADLDKVVDMNPNNILIFFNRGLLKYETNDLEGAYNDFSESIRLYPDFVKAYMVRSAVNSALNRYAAADMDRFKANEIMQKYKKMKGGDKNALIDTNENFRRLIDFSAKGDRIRDVVNGRVQDRNVIVSLKDIFQVQYLHLDSLRQGKVQYYSSWVMEYNQAQNYASSLTISNKRDGNIDFANEKIAEQTALIANGGTVHDYFLRGIFYMTKSDYPAAINDFGTILKKEQGNLLATFNEANARMFMYDYIESIDDKTSKIIGDIEKQDAEIKTETKRMVDFSKVLEGYNRCLELDPHFVFAAFNIANVYVKNEQIEEAIEAYSKVIEMDANIAEAYFNLSLIHI